MPKPLRRMWAYLGAAACLGMGALASCSGEDAAPAGLTDATAPTGERASGEAAVGEAGGASPDAGAPSDGGALPDGSGDGSGLCNATVGLKSPLRPCTAADPCGNVSSGSAAIVAPSDIPTCHSTKISPPLFDDGPPLKVAGAGGVERYACLYRPPGASAAAPRPLVVMLHGGIIGSAGNSMYESTTLRTKAASYDLTGEPGRSGFFLLALQARNVHWPTSLRRDGRYFDFYHRDLAAPSANPDVADLDRLLDEVVAQGKGAVDTRRIFVMGHSSGAYFSELYAIARHVAATAGGHRVAAAAVYSAADPFATLDGSVRPPCASAHPRSQVPIMFLTRACDIVACDEAQRQGFLAEGKLVDSVAQQWATDLASEVGDPNGVWKIVDAGGNLVERCAPSGQCSHQQAWIQHLMWPNGVADKSGKDHEVTLLDFLRSHPI